MTASILVAGVGNIFLQDDGFGVEVVRRLASEPLGEEVELVDVGIRGVHLAYQLLDGYDTLILVDAAPRGGEPGDLFVIEPETESTPDQIAAVAEGSMPLVDAHGMEPASMLATLELLGGEVRRVRIVACEPADVSEGIGLTPAVAEAIPKAVEMVVELVAEANAERAAETRKTTGGRSHA